MYEEILWTIDNEIDWRTFERLCLALLDREGYRHLVPVEPPDGGRDAEGIGMTGARCFFQFSLQEGWKAKLLKDMRTASKAGHDIPEYVFVSSRKIAGTAVDKLAEEVRQEFGWNLRVYSREWLRFRLVHKDPDLAVNYLGLTFGLTRGRFEGVAGIDRPGCGKADAAWKALASKDFARACVEFTEYLRNEPAVSSAWLALAWSQYEVYRYDEAIHSAREAERKGAPTGDVDTVRACILAERGMQTGDSASLGQAERLFRGSVGSSPSAVGYYNLGNVVSAQGRHAEAIEYYRESIELNPQNPLVWKNLASVHHRRGDHDTEMECLDRALEMDPRLIEALVSKGVSLINDFGKFREGTGLLEEVLSLDPAFPARWPHVWYWLAIGCEREGRRAEALHWAHEGLLRQPANVVLRKSKSRLLASMYQESPELRDEAEALWKDDLEVDPYDYDSRVHLAELLEFTGRPDEAWTVIEHSFAILGIHHVVPLRESPFSLADCIQALEYLPYYGPFRQTTPVSGYWDTNHPLYDLNVVPPENENLKRGLSTFLAIPFGKAIAHLLSIADRTRVSRESLHVFYGTLRPLIVEAISEAVWVPDILAG